MKKAYMLLALLLAVAPINALAEGETPAATPLETGVAETVMFSIDNTNVYDGMSKPYKDGYTPAVKDGTATIVLPLLASGTLKDDTITATPGLGEPSSSPFKYSNYQKTVLRADNAVAGGRTVSGYLVRFDLPLALGRFNGVYPVTVDVAAQTTDGTPVQQTFTAYVTVTDGKDPNAAQPTPKPETPSSQPKIIVSGFSVNPASVTAGEGFTATITLENTSEKKTVQNMAVTVTCDCPNFSFLGDSNTIYVGKLAKGDTTQLTLRYNTDLKTPAGRYNISLAMEYDNSDAMTLSSTGTVPVMVVQPLRVELEAPTIPEQANAGDTMPLSFQVMNMGRGPVYNVRVTLEAAGLIPSGSAFIGNMEAGTAATADMNVFVGTKSMTEGYEGDDKYGYTSGKITLVYEDEDGQAYTAETEFSTTIEPPVIAASSDTVEEEPETASQWWISLLIGGVLIAALAVALVLHARKGRRNEDF